MRKKLSVIFTTLFWLICLEETGYTKVVWEKLDITPSATVVETYDSNIFKLRNKETLKDLFDDTQMEDFITTYSFGLNLDYPIEEQRIALSAAKNLVHYNHYREQDYEDELFEENVELRFGDGFFVDQQYTYHKLVIPRSDNIFNDEQDFEKNNKIYVRTGYQANKWELSASWMKEYYDYDLLDENNREIDAYISTFTVIPSSSNKWYIKVSRNELDYDSDFSENDNRMDDIMAGFVFTSKNKHQMEIEGGRREKYFFKRKSWNFIGFVGNLSLLYNISSDVDLSLKLSRITDTSYYLGSVYYISSDVEPGISWDITQKLNLNLLTRITWINYQRSSSSSIRWERSNVYNGRVSYDFHDYVSAFSSYEYQERTANIRSSDYHNNQIMAGISLRWK